MKPDKPKDFPLFPHGSGKWAKKIDGKLKYFGRWADPDGAKLEYDRFVARKTAAPLGATSLTIKSVCNHFLTAKKEAVDHGELSPRSLAEYFRTCKRLIEFLGPDCDTLSLTPASFSAYKAMMGQRWNLVAVGNEVTRVRSLFRWCHETRLIAERVHFGPDFAKASAKALRKHRRLSGKKLFTADEIRRLLDYAGLQLRAMILLGINGGFGPTDCATLPLASVDLQAGWIHYPRPKTEVDRDLPLWPETIDALRAAIQGRYSPQPDAAPLVFVQPDGQTWNTSSNPIAKHFRQVYLWSGLRRAGFYWLRHTFETIGGGAKDQIAVNAIMGHADSSMAAVYREEINPQRLRDVVDHVRQWLFTRGKSS